MLFPGESSMEAITLGIAIGVGATLALKRGRVVARSLVGWSARQAGWIASRVSAAVEDARATTRREYERGRNENLEQMTELPPPSTKAPEARGKSVPPPIVVTPTAHGGGSHTSVS